MKLADFLARLTPQTGGACIEWAGGTTPDGYGVLRSKGLPTPMFDDWPVFVYAHRVAYRVGRGPIPEGFDIEHLCRNRACCNEFHLEPITRLENIRRRHYPESVPAYEEF